MASENQHTIDTLLIEVSLPSRDDEDTVSQAIKKAVQSTLHNLEGTLDRYFDDSFYRLDQLSIEMDIQKGELGQLTSQLQRELTSRMTSFHQSIETDRGVSTGEWVSIKQSPDERFSQLLSHFLKTGSFPWWSGSGESLSELEKWLEQLSPEEWLQKIQPLRQNDPGVIRRFSAQFPASLIRNLIHKSAINNASQPESLIQYIGEAEYFVDSLNLPKWLNARLSTQLYEIALHGLLSGRSTPSLLGNLTKRILFQISPSVPDSGKVLKEWKNRIEKKGKEHTQQWIDVLDKITPGEWKTKELAGVKIPDPDITLSEFAVTQSGLVLLHPFLKNLFENLGLLEDGVFKDEVLHERAVCLLHYLATGGETFEEQTLALPKFLTGWSPHTTVDRFLPISDYEKEECLAVLNGAIRHWPVLKNTSPEGLRVNFLQRQGMLKEEEFGWSLYVENKTHDVLLEKLPWGISIVKLKWMDKMLTVHW